MAEERDPSDCQNAQLLDITCEGQLFKYSQKTGEWEDRWGYIIYGIFTYFSNQEKCVLFKNYLHDSSSGESLRQRFRGALKRYPPRGYIKALNKVGDCVSRVHINTEDNSFKIYKDSRYFCLRTPNYDALHNWHTAFNEMRITVNLHATPTSPIRFEHLNPTHQQCFNDASTTTASEPIESTGTDPCSLDSDEMDLSSVSTFIPRNESIELDRLDKQLEEEIEDLKRVMHEEEDNQPFGEKMANLTHRFSISEMLAPLRKQSTVDGENIPPTNHE